MRPRKKTTGSAAQGGFSANEYEREPVPEHRTKGLGSFVGLFASEHVAAKGYDAVSRFANIAAPWMVVMFLVFGLAALPELGVH